MGRGRQWFQFDQQLMLAVGGLLAIGLVSVYSATYRQTNFFINQIIWIGIGLVGMLIMARIDYHAWHRRSVLLLVAALLGLGATLILGQVSFGATRSLLGRSVQPSEFCKLAVVIYVADWLRSRGKQIRQVSYGLVPFAVILGVVGGLILQQPDISTTIVVLVTAGAMFFIAGAEMGQVLAASVIGGATLSLFAWQSTHGRGRIDLFLDILQNPLSIGPDQPRYVLAALRSGRLFGTGLGQGEYKIILEPAHTDLILGVIGEEMGLLGTLAVTLLIVWFASRAFRIAFRAPDSLGMLMAAGVGTLITLQSVIHIGVITASMPPTGLPLPFVSYGGSSMVVSLTSVGLLTSVWRACVAKGTLHADDGGRWWDWRARLSGAGSD
ncbi:MAG: FtsW/RodA/SpoVE family cell cycle protein [Chloroflexi bacterium]|nr:FtsW/RodA/SpoVE family cell cycle protein [Chloroflexota bacterium]